MVYYTVKYINLILTTVAVYSSQAINHALDIRYLYYQYLFYNIDDLMITLMSFKIIYPDKLSFMCIYEYLYLEGLLIYYSALIRIYGFDFVGVILVSIC